MLIVQFSALMLLAKSKKGQPASKKPVLFIIEARLSKQLAQCNQRANWIAIILENVINQCVAINSAVSAAIILYSMQGTAIRLHAEMHTHKYLFWRHQL